MKRVEHSTQAEVTQDDWDMNSVYDCIHSTLNEAIQLDQLMGITQATHTPEVSIASMMDRNLPVFDPQIHHDSQTLGDWTVRMKRLDQDKQPQSEHLQRVFTLLDETETDLTRLSDPAGWLKNKQHLRGYTASKFQGLMQVLREHSQDEMALLSADGKQLSDECLALVAGLAAKHRDSEQGSEEDEHSEQPSQETSEEEDEQGAQEQHSPQHSTFLFHLPLTVFPDSYYS